MATLELDPLFTRALKLLHSKSKDSEYQLRQMVEDVIAQRKGHPVKHDLSDIPSEPKKARLDIFSTLEKEEKLSKEKEREAEKEKEKEKLKKERELKEKEEKERKEKMAAEKAAASEKAAAAAATTEKAATKERESQDSSDDNMDTDGFAVDLGIACNVCQQFEVTSGNQLIECQECHNLYHQECHKPPVIGQDVNDPRFVWYCTRCVKNLEKMATKPPKPIKSSSAESSKSSLLSSSGSKSSRTDSLDIFPFRRVESKIPPSSMAAKPMSGLVSLAANLSGKTTSDVLSKSSLTKSEQTKHSSSSSSSSSKEAKSSSGPKLDLPEKNLFAAALTMGSKLPAKGPSKTSSSIQMANADKRLQMMKKKAAAKLQEKRTFLK